MMVWRLLGRRLRGLAREEDGAAMVITLAVFFFMYLMIAGVYTVGTAVKNRVQLQLACDAAAYSAAVVQADTLSRIATLNRAMSWTYVQMTRRQMDYVVYKWLQHTRRHFAEDRRIAQNWHDAGSKGACIHHRHAPSGWFIGVDTRFSVVFDNVKLNGKPKDVNEVARRCDAFSGGYLNSQAPSFYAASGNLGENELRTQIRADQTTIAEMDEREDELKRKLPVRIEETVKDVLTSNVAATRENRYYHIAADETVAYLQTLKTKEEDRFLGFAGYPAHRETFRTGVDVWMCLSGDGNGEDAVGFCRKYKQKGNLLSSAWHWWSAWWDCHQDRLGNWAHTPHHYLRGCPHGRCKGFDTCTRSGHVFNARLTAGNLHDDCFDGRCAKPLVLTEDYFGKAGTITVGLAQRNENPWLSLLGDTTRGIFSAFNPFRGCEWSWAFASAKAGYKYLDGDKDADPDENGYVSCSDGKRRRGSKYRIDWNDNNQKWNLCQSDWDAVLLPVRRAETMAADGTWNSESGNAAFLAGYVNGNWNLLNADESDEKFNPDSRMIAGGSKSIDSASVDDLVQRWDELRSVDVDYDNTGNVQAEWAIERERSDSAPGHLDWSRITERMFH